MAIKPYQQIAKQLIEDDKDLHNMYLQIENMVNGIWSPAGDISGTGGIHKVVITDPYDAMNSLRRILSEHEPKITIQPIAPNEETKGKADMMERGLSWIYKQTSKRRATDLTADLAWSAGMYGQIVGQVSYIPEEIKAREAFKGETERLQMALHDSPFLVELHSPRMAHVGRSSYMIEGVLSKKIMRATDAVKFWGTRAGELKSKIAKMSETERNKAQVTVFDYWDDKNRCVWAVIQPDGASIASPLDESIPIMDEEAHEMKFIPWFHRMTGTGLEHLSRNQVMPMLKSVVDTGLYDTMNSLETMIMTKSIKLFGRPTLAEEGMNPASTEIDFAADDLGQTAKVPAGNTLKELRQDVLDQALLTMADRGSARMDKSTVSRLLQTGEFPSGTAASAINIITQSAVASIGPYQRITALAVEDICTLELKFVHFSGEPLTVDGAAAVGQPQVVIDPNDINPNYIYVDVELTAVAPTDQVARANAGNMLAQMGYPMEKVFEQIGETDAATAMKSARRERFESAMFDAKMADIARETSVKDAMAQLQIQQMAQQAAMQQQAQAQPQQQPSGQMPPSGVGGQGFNPAAGGQSPVGPSGSTFETQRGTTRNGTPLPQ